MAEYIERMSAMVICEKYSQHCFEQNDAHGQHIADGILDDVMDIPAADVAEVRHGECPVCSGRKDIKQDCDNGYYVEVDHEQQEMSVWCGDECLAVFSIDYCPNCGAKMDGKGENNG